MACKEALKNAERKRSRMQQRTGEILTTSSSLNRLHAEKINRDAKIKQTLLVKKQKAEPSLSQEEENFDNNSSQFLKVGKWVEVEFLGKRSKKIFHGIIISHTDDAYSVKFAKKPENGSSYFVFPEKDDISDVDASQILNVLPEPMMDHRGHYFFP